MNPNAQNRYQRRRAAATGEILPVEEALARWNKAGGGSICAWDGCTRTFTGDMPAGWVWLLAYWRRQPTVTIDLECKWLRDAVLCSEHAKALDALLKPLAREIIGSTPAGSA
jgi:hypothetical protein